MEKPLDTASAKAALKALESYGERFMSMFDDDDTLSSRKRLSKGGKQANGSFKANGTAPKRAAVLSSSQELGTSAGPGPSSLAAAASNGLKALGGPDRGSHEATPQKRKAADEIDAIMAALSKSGKKMKADRDGGSGAGDTPRAAVPEVVAPREAHGMVPLANLKRERQLFMSSKASKVHEVAHSVVPAQAGGEMGDDDMHLNPEEFKKLQLEVERLGASGLDKKARKKWEAAMLQRLGAQADKTPRTGARIGKGMAAKAIVREGRALEEAIEAGMVRKKGMGKKKAKARVAEHDWGLQELGPGFKSGILKVKPLKSPAGAGGMDARGGGRGGSRDSKSGGGSRDGKKGSGGRDGKKGKRKGGLGSIGFGGAKSSSRGKGSKKSKPSKLPF